MSFNLNRLLAVLMSAGAVALFAPAAAADIPAIEFHTKIYDTSGATNAFHIELGATENTYYDVDCGFGRFEAEVGVAAFDPESQSVKGTWIDCTVSSEGIVRIYGDPSKIDYLYCEGCYIDRISFPELTNLEILNLDHNELESLDLSHMHKLQAIYVSDNPFGLSPLVIGTGKPDLAILEMNIVGHLDQSFNLSDYPSMVSFAAYHCDELYAVDPSGCPNLMRLTFDVTPVETVDISHNPLLRILNVSDTRITSLDLSHNPLLAELYCSQAGSFAPDFKLNSLDISHNSELVYLFAGYNDFTSIDLSNNPKLFHLSIQHNHLQEIDFSANPDLYSIDIRYNDMCFNNLPEPRDTYFEYYCDQNPLSLERCYAEGTVLDFSDRVLREGTTTQAALYARKETALSDLVQLSPDYYSWNNGRLTLHKEYTDSVYVIFTNSMFPETMQTTSLFRVKNQADYGKPSVAASFRPSVLVRDIAFSVGVAGASAENPRHFSVDFGDGNPVDFTATSPDVPAVANVHGTRSTAEASSDIRIYMPEGSDMTAFAVDGYRIMTADFSDSHMLQSLSITDATLPSIDLAWNRSLRSVDLSGNNLRTIDFEGVNQAYAKSMLRSVNLSHNRISELLLTGAITDLDISYNELTEFVFEKLTDLVTADLSANFLSAVDLSACEALGSINLAGNNLASLDLSACPGVTYVNVSGNRMTFAAIDALARPGLSMVYAPQRDVVLPVKAPMADLRKYMFPADDSRTAFRWRRADTGAELTDADVRADNGVFYFAGPQTGNIYCEISNPLFPDFTGDDVLHTTTVQAASMPQEVFVSFTTSADGEAFINLGGVSDGTTVYFDWEGNGVLTQYILETTYTTFPVTTVAGVNVRGYAYVPDGDLTIFSLDGVGLTDIDATPMNKLILFGLYDSGIRDGAYRLPLSPELIEFAIEGGELTGIDLSFYDKLYMLCLNSNHLSTLDLSQHPTLGVVHVAYNDIEEVRIDNPVMWELNLNRNNLSSIDLSAAPALVQLWLSGNNLSSIDLKPLTRLRGVAIDDNCFTFTTLPPVSASYYAYLYGNQKPLQIALDGTSVDLSSQASVFSVPTVYTWYVDSPYYDENYVLTGQKLTEGTDYTINDGVTTFRDNFHNIMCVMTNEAFPDLYLYTNFINVENVGLGNVAAASDVTAVIEGGSIVVRSQSDMDVTVYSVSGVAVASARVVSGQARIDGLSHGIYLVHTPARTFRLAL